MIPVATLERFPEPSAQAQETREYFVAAERAHAHGDWAASDRRNYFDADHPVPHFDPHYNFTEEEW